jgi:IS30 family transposase
MPLRVQRRGHQVRRENGRAGLSNIATRQGIVNDRGDVGPFELDLVIGRGQRSRTLIAWERVIRYSVLLTRASRCQAEMVLATMVELIERVPAGGHRSVPLYQGHEWAG